jgi:uncharacterized protein
MLLYDYVADVLERRAPHRAAHLSWIRRWVDEGRILAAGALGDPPVGAAFVFDGAEPSAPERFADGDPYVRAGLVAARRVLPWTVVAGRIGA